MHAIALNATFLIPISTPMRPTWPVCEKSLSDRCWAACNARHTYSAYIHHRMCCTTLSLQRHAE